jgi:predicted GH43/DUF377 family glycosyl hydrolase
MRLIISNTLVCIYILLCAIDFALAFQDLSLEPVSPAFSSVPNSWEHKGIESPSVIFDGIFKMWYAGTDENNKRRIGYATSPDGINWTRYKNNRCTTNSKGSGCVLNVGNKMSWDTDHIYGMSVVADYAAPESSRYKMWYTGANNVMALKNGKWRTGYAFSSDGEHWIKFNGNKCQSNTISTGCVFDTGAPGSWDEVVAAAPSVMIDLDTSPSERYKMWYEGCLYSDKEPEHVCRIGYATSPDGINWTRYKENRCPNFLQGQGCVFDTGNAGTWDDVRVIQPIVIKTEGRYEMLYAGQSSGDYKFRIGYASSLDGIKWVRHMNNNCNTSPLGRGCLIDLDQSASKSNISDPAVIKVNKSLMIWYRTNDSNFGLVKVTANK